MAAGQGAADGLGDLNGDGRDDILVRHTDGRWYYYPMAGARPIGAEQGEVVLAANPDWRVQGLGDLDGDGRDDVLMRHADGRWRYYAMTGRRGAAVDLDDVQLSENPDWEFAGIGDLNGDGRDDVLLRHSHTGNWYYFPQDGRNLEVKGRGMAELPKDFAWQLVGIGDLNRDGTDDVLLRHERTGRWHYSPMQGTKYLEAEGGSIGLPANFDWSVAGLGDLNGDGRDDILLRHSEGRWRYSPTMHGLERASWDGVLDLPTDPDWRLAGMGDLNGDGRDDVLLRHEDGGWDYRAMDDGWTIASQSGTPNLSSEPNWLAAANWDRATAQSDATCTAPGVPSITSMATTKFALVDINHTTVAYEKLVTVKDSVTVPVGWAKYSGGNGDKVKYLLNTKSVLEETPDVTSGASQSGTANLVIANGGKYDVQVEVCSGTCCTKSAATKIVVADTDGKHLSALPDNSGENNTPYTNSSGSMVASYFVEWSVYGRKFPVDKIPAYNLTHILYGFTPICGGHGINDGLKSISGSFQALQNACAGRDDYKVAIHDPWAAIQLGHKASGHLWDTEYKGNFGQIMELKQRYPSLKILPSIGGWTLSDPFYFFDNATYRTRFIRSVRDYLLAWKFFDGVDIDWEYPGGRGANPLLGDPSKDGNTYYLLMKELRAMLDQVELATGRDMQLTSAVGAGDDKILNINYTATEQFLDYILVMTYDFYGGWSSQVLGHQTALYAPSWDLSDTYNTHAAIQRFLQVEGVPASKLAVGVAMYGRGWTGVNSWTGNHHLSGVATGPVSPGTYEVGVLDYRDIAGKIGTTGWTYHWDTTAQAPYIFNTTSKDLVTYDNADSVKAKGAYVRTKGLAGLFSWEIDGDNGDILNAMHEGLGHGTAVTNRAPVARAGPDFSVDSATNVALDATASYDLDGDTLTYTWSQSSGTTVSLTGGSTALPTFVAPTVTTSTTLTFSVSVSDGTLSHSDSITVTVAPRATNTTPVANAGADFSVETPATVALDGTGSSDADNDTLTYSWSQTSGTTVSLSHANTVRATFNATAVTASTSLTFRLTVSDGLASHTDDVTVTLQAPSPNTAPTVTLPATATVAEGASLTLTATAADTDGDLLTYSWSTGTLTGVVGTSTKTITFTAPQVTADSTYTVSVTVSDGSLTATASTTVTVTDGTTNQAPTVTVPATASVVEGASLTITATASDPNGDTLTYSWNTGTVTGVTGTTTTAITFTAPQVTADTSVTMTVTVSDGTLSTSASVTVTITDSTSTNRAPTVTVPATATVAEGASLTITATASDPDGDTLTYSWNTGTVTGVTGTTTTAITFTAPQVTANTTVTMTVTVSDGTLSASASVVVNITDSTGGGGTNRAPTVTLPATATVVEGASLTLTATASDPDGDNLTYTWNTGTITGATGTTTNAITFTAPQVTADTNVTVSVTVSDGSLTATASVVVTITDTVSTNRAPVANAGVDQRVETPATAVTLSGSATDADGDTLTYAWTEVSDVGVTLTNASSAVATFAVATEVDAPVELTFQLSVSDGTATDTDQTVIILLPATTAGCTQVDTSAGTYPAWEAGTYKQPTKVNHRGLVWQARWETTAEPIVTDTAWPSSWGLISVLDLPWHPDRVYGGSSFGETTKEVDHKGRRYRAGWWNKNQEPGTSGANAWTDIGAATCNVVSGGNTAPTVTLQSTATVVEGASLSITATGSDADGDALTYSWNTGTITGVLGTTSGTITFTAPQVTSDRTVTMTVTVSDGSLTATASVTVTITNSTSTNQTPTVTLPSTASVAEGSSLTITATASDPDGDTLTYSWNTGTITGVTGTSTASITFTAPAVTTNTDVAMTVTVSDGTATASASITVTIIDSASTNQPPTVSLPATLSVAEGASGSLTATASDPDGDTLTYTWTTGIITATGTTTNVISFTAPQVTANTDVTVTVTVSDGTLTASASTTVTITNSSQNQAPTVSLPATLTVAEGASSSLTATASDPDGDTLTYTWNTGTITATGTTTNSISFTAPQVTANTDVTVTVTVSDGTLTASASTTVTITDSASQNQAPTVTVAPTTLTVAEGATGSITATASDPDGDTLTYTWSTGIITATGTSTNSISFTAPNVNADTDVTVTVMVSDGTLTASASMTVTITNNTGGGGGNAPVANAGVDQRVETSSSGTVSVTLSGSGTDADGHALSYSWSQLSGTSVTLTNASSATATFSASGVTADTELKFRLTVSDGTLSDTDQVVIVLLQEAAASCPVVDATAGNYDAWDSNKSNYNAGDKVNHRGLVWQARYWTSKEPIITATAWPQEWGILSTVEIPWHPDRVYGASNFGEDTTEVSHKGRRYRSPDYWIRGSNTEPGTTGGAAWTDIGASTCPW